jgi:hypothetical protein
VSEIRLDGPAGNRVERHEPLLVPFAHAPAIRFIEMDIAQFQIHDLRRAAAGRVKQRQQGPVAEHETVGLLRCGQKSVDHVGAEDVREMLPELGRADEVGDALANHPFQQEIPEEHLDRHQVPRDGRR